MKLHEATSIFPLLEGSELDEFVQSIATYGLLEPIKTHDGLIIDGRNRLRACEQLGIAPRFEAAEINGSVADYVYAMNRDRRHLTDGSKSLAAGRYKEIAAKEAKERQKAAGGDRKTPKGKQRGSLPQKSAEVISAGDARDMAGAKFGVSHSSVDAAEKVLKRGSAELVRAVERDEIAVNTAARVTNLPKSVQSEIVKQGAAAVRRAAAQGTKETESYPLSASYLKELRKIIGFVRGTLSNDSPYGSFRAVAEQSTWDRRRTDEALTYFEALARDFKKLTQEAKELCQEFQKIDAKS